MTTQAEVRAAFWDAFCFDARHEQFCHHMPCEACNADGCVRGMPRQYKGKRQNDLPANVRVAFVDYVDLLARSGEITEALAQRVTL